MIRRYSRAEYVERVSALVAAVPGLTLSTDIIVGFPGETDEDFEATLSLVREVGFKGLFGFKYSERPFTPARKLADDVTEAVKSERLARLFALSEDLLGQHLVGLVGTTQRVVVEGLDMERGELWSGRTDRHEIVHISGASGLDLAGDVVAADIVRSNKHSLQGELTGEARAAARPRVAPEKSLRRSLPLVLASAEGA
jgi:tRNA-2-methylthio-N6-dimethylallyladenosine synthase